MNVRLMDAPLSFNAVLVAGLKNTVAMLIDSLVTERN